MKIIKIKNRGKSTVLNIKNKGLYIAITDVESLLKQINLPLLHMFQNAVENSNKISIEIK